MNQKLKFHFAGGKIKACGHGAALAAVLFLTTAAAPRASAEVRWFRVSEIEYSNRGSYIATASPQWRDAQSNQTASAAGSNVGYRRTHTYASEDLAAVRTDAGHSLESGEEFWLDLIVDGRTKVSCRDVEIRFVFDPSGGVVRYESAGTVLRGYGCKIKRAPDDEYLTSNPN